MTSREALGGEPPTTATPAQVVNAARVQELQVAREQALAQVLDHEQALAQERAQAKRLARSLKRARDRNAAMVTAVASGNLTGQPATLAQYVELGRELLRERELARDRDRVDAQVQARRRALARAEVQAQELERALALAMAQARTLAWEQAQGRAPRLRAVALARFILRLMQAQRGLWDGIVRNLYLGTRVVALAVWMLPTPDRARWTQESYSELEELKQEEAPLLGDAIRIALRIPWLALVLRTHALGRSRTGRWLARREPLWIGLGTAAATFWAGSAGMGKSPTDWQVRSLVAASLLAGVVAAWQARKGRRPRRRRRR